MDGMAVDTRGMRKEDLLEILLAEIGVQTRPGDLASPGSCCELAPGSL